jgi:hypothetical protein
VLDQAFAPNPRKRKSSTPRSAPSQGDDYLAAHCSVLEPLDVQEEGSSFSGDDSIVCALFGLETDSEDERDLEENFPSAPIVAPCNPKTQEHEVAPCAPQDNPRFLSETMPPCVPYKIREFDVVALSTLTNARPHNANNSDQEHRPQHETVSYNENVKASSSRAETDAQFKQDPDTAIKERHKKHHSELYYSMMMAMLQAEESTTTSASSALALPVPPEIKPESPVLPVLATMDDRGKKLSVLSIDSGVSSKQLDCHDQHVAS